MDEDAYRQAYFTDPAPAPRFPFAGIAGVSLYVKRYKEALAFYSAVLGPPAYREGASTHGWRIGPDWLTLFPAEANGPANMDVTVRLASPAAVADLREAFITAGATSDPPSDQLLYEAVRYARVVDPFGAVWILISPLAQE
jgi:catechol 2,3-dioxygenase-like lactoylglutathione lyase family enzyme